jgi:hypothetical protein
LDRLLSHSEQSNASKSPTSSYSSAAATLIESDDSESDDIQSDDSKSNDSKSNGSKSNGSESDANDGDSDAESVETSPPPPVRQSLSSYEQQRLANIQRNQALLKDIDMEEAASKLREDMQTVKKKKMVCRFVMRTGVISCAILQTAGNRHTMDKFSASLVKNLSQVGCRIFCE